LLLNYHLLLVELWHRCGGDLLIKLLPHGRHVAGGTRAYRTCVAGGRPNKTAWSDHLVHFMWEDAKGKKLLSEKCLLVMSSHLVQAFQMDRVPTVQYTDVHRRVKQILSLEKKKEQIVL
jgi:hypothetical protein